MIKFIDNLDNLLSEILTNEKTLIIFYENNNLNSMQLIEKINIHGMDLLGMIILVNYNLFMKENYNKLYSGFIYDFLKFSNINNNFLIDDLVDRLSFLCLKNLKKIKTPQIYFFKKTDNLVEIKYSTHYISTFDNNNTIINLINHFFKRSMEIKKNNYFNEFTDKGEVYLEISDNEIKNNIVFI